MAEPKKSFADTDLKEAQLKDFNFVKTRLEELKQTRQKHYGVDLDTLYGDADRDYQPHRLKSRTKKAIATDEDKGWRGAVVKLGSNDWQSDVSQANVYVKIQTALSILIDQNPSGVFTPTTKKFQATTELIKQLYQRSWEFAKSKPQLKLFVFNLAKYGWAIGRTYPLRLARKVKVLTQYNPENPDESVYEEKEVVEYNDIMRENLDPRNCWIDDMAKPSDPNSVRDWAWRKVYDMDVAKQEFGKYKNWKYVQAGGNTEDTINTKITSVDKKKQANNLVEIFFYESVLKDLFMVIANGVPVVIEPLPISDNKGVKKLSCWQTFWTLRHAQSPYGIGIYEAIRYDQALLDRFRNMTIDQLTMSIYKMFFYQGTQSLTETGEITISPGVGKQVLDPKNVNWLDVPGPGKDAWLGIDMMRKDLDEASAITDPLVGLVTGKTAFEIAQAKESALKRLKNPLDNILEMLNLEGYITISLIQLLYSLPETYSISDPGLIEAYLQEIQGDADLYERDEGNNFVAKVYKEFPLALSKDEQGNLMETPETQFFRVKPQFLEWEGIINIKAQSLLTPSKQVDKALNLEMYNILIPLLDPARGMEGIMTYNKIAKSIVKLYDKDPKEVLPDQWLMDDKQLASINQQQQQANAPLFIDQNEQGQQPPPPGGQAPTLVSNTQLPNEPQGIVGRIASRLAKPFRS